MVENFFSKLKTKEEFNAWYSKMEKIKTLNVFDWGQAKRLINYYGIETARAGLREDWDCTNDIVYFNGDFCKNDAYLTSKWAIPIIMDDKTKIEYECYVVIPYERTTF